MYTCCPHCKTCFRITKAQLDVAQGKVRCGQCKEIYNAKLYLQDELPARPAPTGSPSKPATKPATPPEPAGPDLDLFTAHTNAPDPSTTLEATPKVTASDDEVFEEPDIFADTGEFEIPDVEENNPSAIPEATPEVTASDDEVFEEPDIFADTGEFEIPDVEENKPTALMDSNEFDDALFDDLDESPDDVFLEDELEEDLETEDEVPEGEIEPTAIIETGNVAAEFLSQLGKAEPETRPDAPKDHEADSIPDTDSDATGTSQDEPPSPYRYVDPEDLIKEEKDIAELLEEMNAQLTSDREEPVERNPLLSGLDVDANPDSLVQPSPSPPEQAAPQPTAPGTPSPEPESDDFEQSFLASLDATMTRTPATPAEPAVKHPEPEAPQFSTPFQPGPAGTREDEMPLRLRESLVVEKPPFSPIKFIFSLLAMVILLGGLLVQLTLFRSSDLISRLPALKPVVDRICSSLPCRYSGPRDTSQIELVNRDIRQHPSAKNALLISTTFINRAPFKQPYPVLTVTLSDLSGAIVAQRSFTPAEYLDRDMDQPYLLMTSGQPIRVTLEVIDPGKDAVNFEFTFSDYIKQN